MFAILSPFISSYYGWNWEIKVQYLWKVSLQSFNLKHFMQKVLHLASTKLSWLNISVFFWSPMYLLPWINALFLHFKWFRWLYDLFTTVYIRTSLQTFCYRIGGFCLFSGNQTKCLPIQARKNTNSQENRYIFSSRFLFHFILWSFKIREMTVTTKGHTHYTQIKNANTICCHLSRFKSWRRKLASGIFFMNSSARMEWKLNLLCIFHIDRVF